MQLYEIETNSFEEYISKKLLKTGGLFELELYAEKLAKNLNVKEMQWSLEGGCLVGDETTIIDNKRSLYLSKTKFLLIDAV